MKKNLYATLICLVATLTASAQYGYYPPRPYGPRYDRVQTVSRSANGDAIAWHRFYFGLRVGLNVTSVSGDAAALDAKDQKAGLNIGFVTGAQLTPYTPLFFETGLYYTQKGGKSNYGDGDKFTYDLNYLQLPLLIKYKHFLGRGMSLQPYAGGYLSVGVGGSIKDYGARQAFSSFEDGYFNRWDGGLKIGCGFGYNIFYTDITYDFGLANIGEDDFGSTHNGCFTINVGVNF